jgi:hypothetical protein
MAARKKKTSRKPASKAVKARRMSGAKTTKRKAPKRKAASRKPAGKTAPTRKRKQIVGEGDYEASRTFLKDQAGFVKKNKARIPAMGKAAKAALAGSEGPALIAAEAQARNRAAGEEAPEAGIMPLPPG